MSDEDAQLHVHVDAALKDKIAAEAEDRSTSMRAIVEASIREFLNPDSYKNISLEYLARIDRKYSTVLKRTDLLVEFTALFARIWFRLHPLPDGEERRESLAHQGDARFENFADRLREILADDEHFRKGFEDAIAEASDFVQTPE